MHYVTSQQCSLQHACSTCLGLIARRGHCSTEFAQWQRDVVGGKEEGGTATLLLSSMDTKGYQTCLLGTCEHTLQGCGWRCGHALAAPAKTTNTFSLCALIRIWHMALVLAPGARPAWPTQFSLYPHLLGGSGRSGPSGRSCRRPASRSSLRDASSSPDKGSPGWGVLPLRAALDLCVSMASSSVRLL